MPIRTIRTDQAPSAKPVGVSVELTTDWQTIIDAPQYDVLKIGLGSERRIAPGLAELSSPLLLTNVASSNVLIDCEIVREDGSVSIVAKNFPVPIADALILPVQGQFLLSGDTMRVKASENGAVYATVSYTEGQAEEDDISAG